MINDGEAKCAITPGKRILVDPTSRNTWICLAFISTTKGYKLILAMPTSMILEQ